MGIVGALAFQSISIYVFLIYSILGAVALLTLLAMLMIIFNTKCKTHLLTFTKGVCLRMYPQRSGAAIDSKVCHDMRPNLELAVGDD